IAQQNARSVALELNLTSPKIVIDLAKSTIIDPGRSIRFSDLVVCGGHRGAVANADRLRDRAPDTWSVVRHLIGVFLTCVELSQFDRHHPRPEKLWTRPAVHCALNRLQTVDLAFCLTVAPGQTANVCDPCLRASTFRA
ncbi:hypothetical protein, partial [uncultured Rhizobium sp.]